MSEMLTCEQLMQQHLVQVPGGALRAVERSSHANTARAEHRSPRDTRGQWTLYPVSLCDVA